MRAFPIFVLSFLRPVQPEVRINITLELGDPWLCLETELTKEERKYIMLMTGSTVRSILSHVVEEGDKARSSW